MGHTLPGLTGCVVPGMALAGHRPGRAGPLTHRPGPDGPRLPVPIDMLELRIDSCLFVKESAAPLS